MTQPANTAPPRLDPLPTPTHPTTNHHERDNMSTPAEELTRLQQQIDRCDPEALIDLLIANREHAIQRMRRAITKLRAATEAEAAGHQRLAGLLDQPAA